MHPGPTAHVVCPSARCGAIHEVSARRLGRNMYCPDCGARMTARPVSVERRLAAAPVVHGGGEAIAGLGRLPFAVLLDNVRSSWNVGSILRTADACGVERVVLCGITGRPPDPRIAKTALGAERSVSWTWRPDPREALTELSRAGYRSVALESSPAAEPLSSLEARGPTCLVVGNEVVGVADSLLGACERHVFIPMLGVKRSLNVAVAFGIAAHHVARSLSRADSGPARAIAPPSVAS